MSAFWPLVFTVVFIVGWIWNIVQIVHSSFSPLTGLLIMRIIGVFMAPVGAVLGYF